MAEESYSKDGIYNELDTVLWSGCYYIYWLKKGGKVCSGLDTVDSKWLLMILFTYFALIIITDTELYSICQDPLDRN